MFLIWFSNFMRIFWWSDLHFLLDVVRKYCCHGSWTRDSLIILSCFKVMMKLWTLPLISLLLWSTSWNFQSSCPNNNNDFLARTYSRFFSDFLVCTRDSHCFLYVVHQLLLEWRSRSSDFLHCSRLNWFCCCFLCQFWILSRWCDRLPFVLADVFTQCGSDENFILLCFLTSESRILELVKTSSWFLFWQLKLLQLTLSFLAVTNLTSLFFPSSLFLSLLLFHYFVDITFLTSFRRSKSSTLCDITLKHACILLRYWTGCVWVLFISLSALLSWLLNVASWIWMSCWSLLRFARRTTRSDILGDDLISILTSNTSTVFRTSKSLLGTLVTSWIIFCPIKYFIPFASPEYCFRKNQLVLFLSVFHRLNSWCGRLSCSRSNDVRSSRPFWYLDKLFAAWSCGHEYSNKSVQFCQFHGTASRHSRWRHSFACRRSRASSVVICALHSSATRFLFLECYDDWHFQRYSTWVHGVRANLRLSWLFQLSKTLWRLSPGSSH